MLNPKRDKYFVYGSNAEISGNAENDTMGKVIILYVIYAYLLFRQPLYIVVCLFY